MAEEQIGKYRVLGELGKGSMGMVYRAEDPEIGRIVAIKTLRSVYMGADAAGQEALQRFRQEARSAGMLKHPNIVTIFETGRTESGSPYIVMEYISGDSLETRLGKPIEPLEALHLLSQIGSAIDYAHGFHMVHRDIKPSNVIIDAHSKAHLLDFGVAKLNDTSLTPAGTVVGTPSYMAPEQIRGEALDGATDRFALAVVAYEMLVGSRPFPGNDFMTVVSNIIHTEPIPFAQANTTAPVEFEPVLRKGLSKDRSQRYASCLELVRALAKPFNVTVDSSGVVGYREGMKLADLQPAKKAVAGGDADAHSDVGATMVRKAPDFSADKKVDGKAPGSSPDNKVVEPQGGGSGRWVFALFLVLLILGMGVGGWAMLNQNRLSRQDDDAVDPTSAPTSTPTALVLASDSSTTTVPLIATEIATVAPTEIPTPFPTDLPTPFPTQIPTPFPTDLPTDLPTEIPTPVPTPFPTDLPTEIPTPVATLEVFVTPVETPAIAVALQTPTAAPDATPDCLLSEGCSISPTPAATPVIDERHSLLIGGLSDSSLSDTEIIAAVNKLSEAKYSDIPYPAVAPVLLKLVRHPNFKVRIAVLKIFTSSEKFRTREVFREIVDRLDDSEFLVRGFTVKFLGSLNNEAGTRLLEAHLPKETDAKVKKLIEDTLRKSR